MKKIIVGALAALSFFASFNAMANGVRSVADDELITVEAEGGPVGVPTPPGGTWYNP